MSKPKPLKWSDFYFRLSGDDANGYQVNTLKFVPWAHNKLLPCLTTHWGSPKDFKTLDEAVAELKRARSHGPGEFK